MHWHGYMFLGDGASVLSTDASRRHGSPGFLDAAQLPYVVQHTLFKSRRFVLGTWHDIETATEWLRSQSAQLPAPMYPSQSNVLHDYAARAASARETLARGQSVVWGLWLNGPRYADLRVVCCTPGANWDNAPCPTGS